MAGVLTQHIPVEVLKQKCLQQGFPWASIGRVKKLNGESVREVVTGFFSKMNSAEDAKLGATALECLAVVLSSNHFRSYIWGRPVTVVTDASALRWLLSLSDGNGKLLRWAMRLHEYDIRRALRGQAQQQRRRTVTVAADGGKSTPPPTGHADENWPECVDTGRRTAIWIEI